MSNFTQNASEAGQGIGGFLGGILNPIVGDQTITVEKQTSEANNESSKTTAFVVIGILLVVVITAFVLFGKKTKTEPAA